MVGKFLTFPFIAVALFLSLPVVDASAAASLTVNVVGTGSGEVSSNSHLIETQELKPGEAWPPIRCTGPPKSGQCTSTLIDNYTVLYAFPDPGSSFAGWTIHKGEALFWCEAKKEERGLYACLISDGASAAVTAAFNDELGEPLTVNIEKGLGTVVSNPAGIECWGEASSACSKSYEAGEVTLTASPNSGYLFEGWTKCDPGGADGRQCTVAAGVAKTVGVRFVRARSLQGSQSGGLGILSTSPGGINCGYACSSSSARYTEGSLIIRSKPAVHYHFVEFMGGTGSAASCNGVTTETCTLATFKSDSAIKAVYAPNAKNILTLEKAGGGQGFVETKPSGVLCGYTCSEAEAEYYASDTVEVNVKLNKGTTKLTWTTGAGTCTGSTELLESECTVPMSSTHELVAKFE